MKLTKKDIDEINAAREESLRAPTGRERIPAVGPGSEGPQMLAAEGRGVPMPTPPGPPNPMTGDEKLMEVMAAMGGGAGGRAIGSRVLKAAPRIGGLIGEAIGSGAGTDAASDQPGAFARGAGGQLFGAGIGKGAFEAARRVPGLNRVLTPLSESSLIPGARAADQALQSRGEGLLLSQAIDAPWIQNAERMADEAMVLGRGPLARGQLGAEQAAKDIAEMYAASAIGGRGRTEVGTAVEHFLTKKYGAFQSAAGQLYRAADQAAKGTVLVDIEPLQKEAAKLMESGALHEEKGLGMLTDIISRPSTVTFKQAHELRSSLLERSRDVSIADTDKRTAAKYAMKFSPIVDKQMESGAKLFSPSALAAYRQASSFYKRGVKPFADDTIQAILNKEPEAVARYLVPLSGQFKTTAIRSLHEASKGDPRALDALKGHYVAELFRAAGKADPLDTAARAGSASSTQYVSGDRLLKLLNQDKEGLTALLGHRGHQELLGLSSTMARAEAKPGALGKTLVPPTARMFLAGGMYIGAMLGSSGVGAGAGTTLLIAPNALNHMLASRTLRRWLIGGNAPPPGSRAFSRALGGILSQAMEAQRIYGKDAVKIKTGAAPEAEGPTQIPDLQMR